MHAVEARQLLQELHRRQVAPAQPVSNPSARLGDMLATRFDFQRAFIRSPAKRKAVLGTRRAGKTETAPAYIYDAGATYPRSLITYVAITRLRAQELLWQPLKDFDERFSLGCVFNETLLSVTLPNGSVVRLTGADKLKEADKKRGDKNRLVIIDEAQMYPPEVLHRLVDEVFGPTLEDLQGTLVLLGTPGLVCDGYWYDVTRNDETEAGDSREKRLKGWEVYEWNVLDNPALPHMRARLPEMLKERGWTEKTPTFVREWRGVWVNDADALVYAFSEDRNVFLSPPPGVELTHHVVGIDLGHDDAFARVVWGFSDDSPNLYEVEAWKKSGLTPTDWRVEIERAIEKYHPIATVVDTGGLGKASVVEWQERWGLSVEAAEKANKSAYIQAMNDDLLTGRIKVHPDSALAKEWKRLPKNPEAPLEEHPGYPNHCSDAGLYAWRKALHWLGRTPEEKPPPGSAEAAVAAVQAHEDALEEALLEQQREEAAAWEDMDI